MAEINLEEQIKLECRINSAQINMEGEMDIEGDINSEGQIN